MSEETTYTAVFSCPISSKFIVSEDVRSAMSLLSNLPNLDCNVLKIDPLVFSGAISIDL